MTSRTVPLLEIDLIAATRVALGIGVGLFLADRLNPHQRRAAAWSLLAVGVLSTIPLAADVLFRRSPDAAAPHPSQSAQNPSFVPTAL